MKHPIWIVNAGLLTYLLLSLSFIYFSRIKMPIRESIAPTYITPHKESKVIVNTQKIYENDLFGTFVKEVPRAQSVDVVMPFPNPPVFQRAVIPVIPEPEFLDPLPITLIGIIVVGSNDVKNRAIIRDDKTNQEGTYKVGDIIQDSQLIRIFKNKIILLRLNGQQEVLYLRELDAKNDMTYATVNDWQMVVHKVDDTHYNVNPFTFVERITNLSQCIEAVNVTTAYKDGKSVGLTVGSVAAGSLAQALGFKKSDLITEINGIATATMQERLAIYKNIIHLPVGHTVSVSVMRNNQSIMLYYLLQDFSAAGMSGVGQSDGTYASLMNYKNSYDNKKAQYAFAPTVNKIRHNDHQMMLENSKISNHYGS